MTILNISAFLAPPNDRLSAPEAVPQKPTRLADPSPVRLQQTPQEQAEVLRAKALEYKKGVLLAKKKGDLPAASK